MEEVLRKLYQEHHSTLQRKRIQKVIDGQQKVMLSRRKYDFREEMSLKTPETNFSLDEDIRFEKEFHQTKQTLDPTILQSRCHPIKLPFLTNKERRNKLKRKLKTAFLAVLFTERLKGSLKQFLLRRKRKAEKYSKSLVSFTQSIVRNYYQQLLKEELIEYTTILERTVAEPALDQEKESLQMLYYLSSKLASSSLTKELMGFFLYTATERGFPPSDFLSQAEIDRLDFSPLYGCLINVSQEQTRMLLALGLGVKIFCYYILYQPWKLSQASQFLGSHLGQLKKTITDIGSVFSCLLLEQFCLNLKEVRTVSKQMIQHFQVRAIKTLDPFGDGQRRSTSKVLIEGQNRTFLNHVSYKYPNLVKSIRDNLFVWISRISYACLRENQHKSNGSQGASTFFRTIETNRPPRGTHSRRRFRSIELTRKKGEESHRKGRYSELPELKHSVD